MWISSLTPPSRPLLTRYQAPPSKSSLVQLGLDENNQIRVYHYWGHVPPVSDGGTFRDLQGNLRLRMEVLFYAEHNHAPETRQQMFLTHLWTFSKRLVFVRKTNVRIERVCKAVCFSSSMFTSAVLTFVRLCAICIFFHHIFKYTSFYKYSSASCFVLLIPHRHTESKERKTPRIWKKGTLIQ